MQVETCNGFELRKLTDMLIMKEWFGNSLPDGVCRALESMTVTIIRSLPTWLKDHQIQDYLYSSTAESVVRLLGNIPPNDALRLNTICRNEDRKAFAAFIGKCESLGLTSGNARQTLKQLKIFDRKTKSSDRPTLVAVEDCREILEKEDFPVKYPRPFLVSTSNAERNLAFMLGATIVKRTNLILDTLEVMKAGDGRNKYSASDTIEFMKYLLRLVNKIESNSSIMNAMKCIAFVESSGTLKMASDVFDRTERMAAELFYGESVFPDDKELTREPYLSGLLKLGMRRLENLQARDLLQTADCLDKMSKSRCDNFVVSKSKAFQKVAEKYPELLSPPIRSKKCIFPRISRINGYPEEIQWFGSKAGLCTPSSITSSAFAPLVGSVQAVVDTKSASKLSEHFAWNKSPAVSQVMCNFQIVIRALKRENKPQLLSLIDSVYTYMSKQHHFDVILQVLKEISSDAVEDINIILCGEQFVCPRKVYFSDNGIGISLQPYLFKLSDEFQHFTTLFSQLGCHECVTSELLLDILECIKDKYDTVEDNAPNDVRNDLRIVIGITNWFRDTMDEKELKPMSILVPIYTGNPNHLCLKPARDCTYCESASLEELSYDEIDSRIVYVHPDIAEQTARKLGVMTTERRRLKDNSMAIPFGQKETLVTRLKGLLKGYPCDTGIMKELIQNADDAKATEIHFIKDYRTHGTEKVWDEMYCPLQGPALCVFNNSSFTQEDLKGIQDLGKGSKAEDPTKTGQYGVGFNAVYNLTDAPSFLTKSPDTAGKETLCFFDPMCKYIPDIHENCPGKRIMDLQRFRRDFPDMMSGYLENKLFQNKVTGTMFRLPLRMTESELSRHFKMPYELDKLLKEFEKEVLEILLFVKHVTKITISNISTGQLVEEYTVDVTLSEESNRKRELLFRQLETFSSVFEENRASVLDLPYTRDSYEMTVTESSGESRYWCIVQQIGFETNIPIDTQVRDAYRNGDIGLLPQGGIAVLLSQCSETSKTGNRSGKAFCFLPLPIDTGLPVEVHGHFSLDHETRRTLWEDEESYRTKWNKLILKGVVAPAYVTALELCMQSFFPSVNIRMEQRTADYRLRRFENYFPLIGRANGPYWRWLAQCVYQFIYDNEVQLFPIFRHILAEQSATSEVQLDASKAVVSISWTALQIKDFKFPAYFVPKYMLEDDVGTLQRLGMRLIRTSKQVQESVQSSNRKAIALSKKSVVSFLRSHNDSYKDKCHTGGINRPVDETQFQDMKSVRTIAKYCFRRLENEDAECFDGVPLLVTNDGYLREFTVSQAVFLTPYCGLLQSLGHLFVSSSLDLTFLADLSKQGLCKELLVEDFLELFQQSEERKMVGTDCVVEWNPDSVQIPNKYWLKTFWTFIGYKTQGKKETLEKCLTALGQLSFVPSTAACLHPVSELYTFVRRYTFSTDQKLKKAVEKLQLPELNKDYLPDDPELLRVLNTYVASAYEPGVLLRCFAFHQNKINSTQLSSEESDAVLRFFTNGLCVLKQQCDSQWVKYTLKRLRLYTTQQNTLVSISPEQEVIVIPGAIPIQGIDLWASRMKKLILKEDAELEELYKFLDFKLTKPLEFYTENVNTLAREITENDFMEHLFFIKDDLLTTAYGRDYSNNQKRMIEVLANTPFIRVGRRSKKVSELKSHKTHVFQLMCTIDDFPPATYDRKVWYEFFVLIGLQTNVTDTQYLDFAQAIAEEVCVSGMTNELQEKSVALTKSLINETRQSISSNTLHELSNIKFVVPAQVEQRYLDIYRLVDDDSPLICYNGSVNFENGKTFWTTVHLLHRYSDPNEAILKPQIDKKWLCENLNILQLPTDENVILHCQRIGDALKRALERMEIEPSSLHWITSLMDRIYNALVDIDENELKERLFHTPLVFLPGHLDILPAYMTILNCTKAHEIPPYIRKIPSEFARYHDLFESLGASQEPSLGIYMHVLCAIHRSADENELNPAEIDAVRSAISNLLEVLKNKETQSYINAPSKLYLPDTEAKLKDANSLVMSDNAYIQRRIGEETSIIFFLGMEKLKLDRGKLYLFKKLPPPYKPIFLTDITDQKVDLECMDKYRNDLSIKLERFFHSAEFVSGVLRLLKANCNWPGGISTEKESTFANTFLSISAWQVASLKTYVALKSNEEWVRIPHSEDNNKVCYIDKDSDDRTVIYFTSQENETYSRWDNLVIDLAAMVQEQVQNMANFKHIIRIVGCIGDQEQISNILDRLGIPDYNTSRSLADSFFPSPGTYVPLKFHPFLDNSRPNFDEREYRFVAMEIFDPLTDEDPLAHGDSVSENAMAATYIYVTIIERVDRKSEDLPMYQRYRVNVGEPDYVTVPAYKLYRFVRIRNTIRDIALLEETDRRADEQQSVDTATLQSFNDACKEIRDCLTESWNKPERRSIILFLWRKYHPDKHQDNKKLYHKICVYLQQCISRLENGQPLLEEMDDAENMSSAQSSFFSGMNERYDSYRDTFKDDYFPSASDHRERASEPQPSPSEARIWRRQADADLQDAKMSLRNYSSVSDHQNIPAANWICYRCHQVIILEIHFNANDTDREAFLKQLKVHEIF